jgi:hypothetical protein
MAGARGFVAVVGARVVPESVAPQVAAVVRGFLARGWGIGSGGARGADAFALRAVVAAGPAACAGSVVFLPGAVPARAATLQAFVARGGRVVPGAGTGRLALLGRSRRLAQASAGVVAFLWGPSRGSVFTVREAIRAGKPAAVVLAGGGAVLPAFSGGQWVPCRLGSIEAFRWQPGPVEPARPSWLARVFRVPEGEPTQAQLEHIALLSAGERLWFERGVLAGDTVLVAHEALSDTPAFLATRRLMRRFRCGAREAAGLAELFLALDAGPDVVAHYEGEAQRVGVAAVMGDLVALVARLALVEQAPEDDALEHAEALGDDVEWVDAAGRLAQSALQGRAEAAPPTVQWHVLGTVQPEQGTCPVCGAVVETDPDAAEVPTCAACGTRDTWEARQGGRFRGIVGAIDACPSLEELGPMGKRLYALGLSHEQASVAWSHFQLRKSTLERQVALCPTARALLTRVERATPRSLGPLGGRLYQLQHTHTVVVSTTEWRRIWAAYRARRCPVRV